MLYDTHLFDTEFLTDILRNGVLVDYKVEGLSFDEILGHVPYALEGSGLAL